MGQHTEPILSTALAARAMADIGTNQANRLPPARAPTPSRCHTAHRRGRGGEAYVVRAAFRHDKTEADELPLVCVELQQMASDYRVPCGRYPCGVECSIGIELFGRGRVAAGSSRDGGEPGTICQRRRQDSWGDGLELWSAPTILDGAEIASPMVSDGRKGWRLDGLKDSVLTDGSRSSERSPTSSFPAGPLTVARGYGGRTVR